MQVAGSGRRERMKYVAVKTRQGTGTKDLACLRLLDSFIFSENSRVTLR